MGQIDFTQIPYSQHHREAAMMLGASANQSLFTYLFDEYLFRLRTGKETSFKLSRSRISSSCQMNRRTVANALEKLEVMKLIKTNGNTVYIDSDNYLSLIYAFHNTPLEQRQSFVDALGNGDYDTLKSLGYVFLHNSSESLKVLEGGVCKNAQSCTEIPKTAQKCTGTLGELCKNAQFDCAEIHTPVQKCAGDGDSSENCAEMRSYKEELCKNAQVGVQKYTGEADGTCAFLHRVVQKCTDILNELCRNTQVDRVDCAFLHSFEGVLDEDVKTALYNAIFDENASLSEDDALCIFTQLFAQNLCRNTQLPVQKCTPEINNNKEEKNKTPEHEVFFTLGKVDTTFLDRDEELPEQKRHVIKNRTIFRTPEYPYFPEYKVLEFISDIHACADNGVKLFLYNFNQELHARFDVDEVRDEETGDIIRESSTDYHQFVIARSEFKDMVGRSIDDALEAIDTGYIYTDDNEKVEITATMEHPETLVNIIDWKFQLIGDGEECCEVDWGKIQNPDEEPLEDIQPVRFKRTKPGEVNQERENNRKFIARLLELGEDDDTWGTLTPMEKLVYNFLCDHFQFSDDGREVVDIKGNRYLNRNVILRFIVTEKESRPDTPSKEELFSVFSVDKPDMYGGITLRESMFSAAKIQRWNKKHGLQGIVITSDDKTTTEQ